MGCRLRAYNCRGPQFTADDCSMAGQPSLIGYNCGDLAHRRYHVRACHLRDENIALFYPAGVFYVTDDDNPARSDTRELLPVPAE